MEKILLVGNGGREHALAWKIAQSPLVKTLYCAPGNPGMAGIAQRVPIPVDDLDALADFAVAQAVDLVVVGPELPLVLGLQDRLEALGIPVFGPSRRAAELEGSKSFMKEILHKYAIPTAPYAIFRDPVKAADYIRQQGAPIVVKCSGLAAGKGVIVCPTEAMALEAIERIMIRREFGAAGDEVVVESFLVGEELSLMVLVDGEHLLPLADCQDHKAVGDGDTGPNTGGMGAYSPTTVLTPVLLQRAMTEIILPVVKAMAAEGRPYRGVLYAGLMIDGQEVRVLEFNVRFGDPETQPLLMRMQSDLVPLLMASARGSLRGLEIAWDPRTAVCVVLASGGYPGAYATGHAITMEVGKDQDPEVQFFHAGTREEGGRLVTAGGRVLGVTALGETPLRAQQRAYLAVTGIHWEGMHYRRDIGWRAVARGR